MSANLQGIPKKSFANAFAFGHVHTALTIFGYVPGIGTVAAVIRVACALWQDDKDFPSVAGSIIRATLEIATGPILLIYHLGCVFFLKRRPRKQRSCNNPLRLKTSCNRFDLYWFKTRIEL